MLRTLLALALLALLATISVHVRYDGARTRFALEVSAGGVDFATEPRPARLDCVRGALLRYDACPTMLADRAPGRI